MEYYNEILLTDRGHTGREACLGPESKGKCCRFVELFVAYEDVQRALRNGSSALGEIGTRARVGR